MKRCVVHFGMFKTGSSSIQQSFWKQLNSPQWKYMNFGNPNHGGALNRIFFDNPNPRRHIKTSLDSQEIANKKAKALKKIAKELNTSADNLLISAEWLSSNAFKLSQAFDFYNLLSSHAESVCAVGYIRPPKAYMESSFQEMLKHGSQELSFEKLYPKYRERIEKFDQAFGKENVLVWQFDPSSFPNGCVVQDFCKRLDIDFPVASIKRINESLSQEATSFLYTYRKYGPGYGSGLSAIKENKLLIERLAKLPGSKLRFSWTAIRPILDKNISDMKWMEDRMSGSLEESRQESADAIASEEDLLRYKPESLLWLTEQLGIECAEQDYPEISPQQVADWLHLLRIKLAEEDAQKPSDDSAKNTPQTKHLEISALVRHAKQAVLELDALPDDKAVMLISEVFKQIAENIENNADERINVNGLGVFRTRQATGSEQNLKAKRTTFHID